MASLPWVEKYRPSTMSEVLGHEPIIRTFKAFIAEGQLPHILLHGPPGTGKTSVVKALVRTLCRGAEEYRVLELNASDDRGIQTVRERIKVFADASLVRTVASEDIAEPSPTELPAKVPAQPKLQSFFVRSEAKPEPVVRKPEKIQKVESAVKTELISDVPLSDSLDNIKLVVLDEADQMTTVAQTALRRIMEMHAGHVRFILMCNEVDKISPPIQSRCCKFTFSPVPEPYLRQKLSQVIEAESVNIEPNAVDELIQLARGDFRKLLNTLQACTMSTRQNLGGRVAAPVDALASSTNNQQITVDIIRRSLGLPEQTVIEELIRCLRQQSFEVAYAHLTNLLLTKGCALTDIVDACYADIIAANPSNKKAVTVIPRLAEIKTALAQGSSSLVQAGCLVACFVEMLAA